VQNRISTSCKTWRLTSWFFYEFWNGSLSHDYCQSIVYGAAAAAIGDQPSLIGRPTSKSRRRTGGSAWIVGGGWVRPLTVFSTPTIAASWVKKWGEAERCNFPTDNCKFPTEKIMLRHRSLFYFCIKVDVRLSVWIAKMQGRGSKRSVVFQTSNTPSHYALGSSSVICSTHNFHIKVILSGLKQQKNSLNLSRQLYLSTIIQTLAGGDAYWKNLVVPD